MATRWICLGVVGKAHGLAGAFFVSSREEALPTTLHDVVVGDRPETGKAFKVLRHQVQSGRPLLQVEEISTREAVDPFKGQPIWCRREQLGLKSGEYCWADLIGKKVVDVNDVLIGTITDVANHGASDFVNIVEDSRGELPVPFVDAYFDLNFDPESDVIKMIVTADTFDEAWQP